MPSTVRGGDIRQFTIDGREYTPQQDAEFSYRVGAQGRKTNETTIAGNGEVYSTQTTQPVGITSATIVPNSSKSDVEAIQELANGGESVSVTMTLASGVAYGGQLVVNGEIDPSSNGSLEFSLLGASFGQI